MVDLVRRLLCSEGRIQKGLRDILLAFSAVSKSSLSTTSDSKARAVRNINDSIILSKWDEIILQLKRADLHFFLITETSSEFLILGATDPPVFSKTIFVSSVVSDDDDLADLLHVQDQKTAGTAGGTFTSGSFQTRTLNTVVTNEISGASLASNQMTLPSGTYEINARAPAFGGARHKTKLRDITGAADLIVGSSAFNRDSTNKDASTDSIIVGRFTLSVQSDLEIQHRIGATQSTNGFGVESNFGVIEVYTEVMIKKIS